MNGIGAYLLRIVAASFLLSLCMALTRSERLKKILRLSGGCFLAIVVLQPLLCVRLDSLPDPLAGTEFSAQQRLEEAKEKNAALLEELIRTQTSQRIQKELAEEGVHADFTLELRYDEKLGAPVPWSIRIRSACTEAERAAISTFLSESLGIPEERQSWQIG